MGLNDHHVLQAVNFMRFCRYKRAQRLKAVDHCFQDLKESRYEIKFSVNLGSIIASHCKGSNMSDTLSSNILQIV